MSIRLLVIVLVLLVTMEWERWKGIEIANFSSCHAVKLHASGGRRSSPTPSPSPYDSSSHGGNPSHIYNYPSNQNSTFRLTVGPSSYSPDCNDINPSPNIASSHPSLVGTLLPTITQTVNGSPNYLSAIPTPSIIDSSPTSSGISRAVTTYPTVASTSMKEESSSQATSSISKSPTVKISQTITLIPTTMTTIQHEHSSPLPSATPTISTSMMSSLPTLSNEEVSPSSNSNPHPSHSYGNEPSTQSPYTPYHHSQGPTSPPTSTTSNPNNRPAHEYGYDSPTLTPSITEHPQVNDSTRAKPTNNPSKIASDHPVRSYDNRNPTQQPHLSYHPSDHAAPTLASPDCMPEEEQPQVPLPSYHPTLDSGLSHTTTPSPGISISRQPTYSNHSSKPFKPTQTSNSSISSYPIPTSPYPPRNYGNDPPTYKPLVVTPHPLVEEVPLHTLLPTPTCTLPVTFSPSNVSDSNHTSQSTARPSSSLTMSIRPSGQPQSSYNVGTPSIQNTDSLSSEYPVRYPSPDTNKSFNIAPRQSSPSPSWMSFPVPVTVIVVDTNRPTTFPQVPPLPPPYVSIPTIAPASLVPTSVTYQATTNPTVQYPSTVRRYHVTTRFQFFMRNISSLTAIFPNNIDQNILLRALAFNILGFSTLNFTAVNSISMVGNSTPTAKYSRLRSLDISMLKTIRRTDLFKVIITVNYSTHSNLSIYSNVNSFSSQSLRQYLNSSIQNGMLQVYTRRISQAQKAFSLDWVEICRTTNCSLRAFPANRENTGGSNFETTMYCSQIRSSEQWNQVYGYSEHTIITPYFIWLLCLLVAWILVLFWSIYLLLSKCLLPTEIDQAVAILNAVRMRQTLISILVSLSRILWFSMVIYMTFKLKQKSFACVEFFLQVDFWDPYLNLVEAVLYPLLMIVVILRQERYHLLIDSSVLEFAANQQRMLQRIAKTRIALATVSVCFVMYGVTTTALYSSPHHSSPEATKGALKTYTLVGIYTFSVLIFSMKLLYPSIVIGTIQESVMAKAAPKHVPVRFSATADNYSRLPTAYSHTSDDVDTVFIIGGEVIDLEEEEDKEVDTVDDDDHKNDFKEERKSTASSAAALPNTLGHTSSYQSRRTHTVNFDLPDVHSSSPRLDVTENSIRRDENSSTTPSPDDEQTVVRPHTSLAAQEAGPSAAILPTSTTHKHEIQFKENSYVVAVTLLLPALTIISTALFKISDPIAVLVLNSIVVYVLQLCFVVLCTSTSISIIGSEIIERSRTAATTTRTANGYNNTRSNTTTTNMLARQSVESSSSSLPSHHRNTTGDNDPWSVQRIYESQEAYNMNWDNSIQELNDLRNLRPAATMGRYQLCGYTREEQWNYITARSRSRSSGGILQRTHSAMAMTTAASSSYVMASRHYPHSESGWLVMWLSRSGGEPTYSIHDDGQHISTV